MFLTIALLCGSACSWVTGSSYFEGEGRVDNKARRSAAKIQVVSDAIFKESLRFIEDTVAIGTSPGPAWAKPPGKSYVPSERGNPSRIPQLPLQVLREAYSDIPEGMLQVQWVDGLAPTAASGVGILLNTQRLAELAWGVDSAVLIDTLGMSRHFLDRRPGDYAVLLIISHELAHFAMSSTQRTDTLPPAVTECAADIVAGFQSALISTRMGARGVGGLEESRAALLLGHLLAPGEWIARASHPDNDQRTACLERGISLYSELLQREQIASSLVVDSPEDSLHSALVLRETSLTSVALAGAYATVTTPTHASMDQRPPGRTNTEAALVAPIVSLLQKLMSVRESSYSLPTDLVGPTLSPGVTLFPGATIRELVHDMPRPWRCAILEPGEGSQSSVACYLITDVFSRRYQLDFEMERHLNRVVNENKVRVSRRTLPNFRGSDSETDEWVVSDATNTLVITLRKQTREGSAYPYSPSSVVYWVSYEVLRFNSPSQ